MDQSGSSSITQIRFNPQLRQGFKLGETIVIPSNGEVIRHGEKSHLAPKAMEILLFMVQHSGQVLSNEELLDFGWGDEKANKSGLTHVISEIRHALDDHKECPEYIQTLPRKGYRLITPIEYLDENIIFPDVWSLSKGTNRNSVKNDKKNRRWFNALGLLKQSKLFQVSGAFIIATWVLLQVLELIFPILNIPDWGLKVAVLVLALGFPVALLFTWINELKAKDLFLSGKNSSHKKKALVPVSIGFCVIAIMSIAVGFLANYLVESIELEQQKPSGFKSDIISIPIDDKLLAVLPVDLNGLGVLPSYFVETLQSEIINGLNQQSLYHVVSERAINDLPIDASLQTYVSRLGARFLVESKLNADGKNTSLSLNIIDGKTYAQVWNTNIPVLAGNLLQSQNEINRQIGNALRILSEGQSNASAVPISTLDFKSYDQYIQGKSALVNAKDEQALLRAEEHFLLALNFDPKFFKANSGLCQTYLDRYELTKKPQVFLTATSTCNSLLSRKNLKEEGYVALGTLYRIKGEYQKATEFYLKAIDLNNENVSALLGNAKSVTRVGKFADAEALFLKAVALEPGFWKNYMTVGDFYFENGRYGKSAEYYARVTLLKRQFEEGFNRLGASYFLNDKIEQASETWQRSLALKPSAANYSNLGTALFLQQKFAEAQNSYLKALELQRNSPTVWANLGDSQKYLGQSKAAAVSYKEALRLIKEQLLINPHDNSSLAMSARYQSELSNCSAALSVKQQLVESSSSDPYLFYDLAIIALNCKQIEQARLLIQKAVSLGYSSRLLARDVQFSGVVSDDLFSQKGENNEKAH